MLGEQLITWVTTAVQLLCNLAISGVQRLKGLSRHNRLYTTACKL